MSIKRPVWTVSFGLALAVAPFSLSAQQGTLIGTVTDELTGGFFEQNCVDSFAIFDIDAGYEVLDTGYRSFPGAPKIGRFAMVRIRYELF